MIDEKTTIITSKTRRSVAILPERTETFTHRKDDPQGGSQRLLSRLEGFLMPFVCVCDEALEKRLVRTFL
jgi:hypothetical protein